MRRKEGDVEDRRSAQYTRYCRDLVLYWVIVLDQSGRNGGKRGLIMYIEEVLGTIWGNHFLISVIL